MSIRLMAMVRIGALTLFTLWLLAIQFRYSWEQWEARGTFRFAPFLLAPFSNRIEFRGERTPAVEVVSVNGRPLTGHSVYWQAVRHRTAPFDIRVRRSGREEQLEVFSSHCTCGRLSDEEIGRYLVLPPAVALLAGLLVAWRRPREPAGWLFLLLMVSLGQVEIFGTGIESFPQHFNAMAWTDPLRLPYLAWSGFAAAAWPAWLILLLCRLHQPALVARANWLAGAVLMVALLRGLLAVGLAENTLAVAPLHKLLAATETPRILALLTALALVPLLHGAWRLALAIPLLAGVLFYWPAPEVRELAPLLPEFHRTPEFIVGTSALALAVCWLAATRAGWLDWAILASWCVPALLHLRHLGGWEWWWLDVVPLGLAMAGLGVALGVVRCLSLGDRELG